MKYFFGPMSKNIVDTVIKFSIDHPLYSITFIPSRRQIEFDGGYVNNWRTSDFCKYVKDRNLNILIERDHGGPGQGANTDDDGYESLNEDCKYMDLIHIDPWKKYSSLEDGIKWTINMINFCNELNPNLQYEIGTEEAIRFMDTNDIETLLETLKNKLSSDLFNKIKFVVIQCGTALCEDYNTGVFDQNKLSKMIEICKKYKLIAKEHNGDYISLNTSWQKSKLGLQNVNIAPEMANIETRVILQYIKNSSDDFEKVYQLCYQSGKWRKWVSDSFNPEINKEKIILISCHYIYSTPEFQNIKQKYIDIDMKICETVYEKLLTITNIYNKNKRCMFCNCTEFDTVFKKNYISALSANFFDTNDKESYFMPFNIVICKQCKSGSLKYLGNLDIIYHINHVDAFGKTKTNYHKSFCDFIVKSKNINGIIEVGACTDTLASMILDNINTDYYVVDPGYSGDNDSIKSIKSYVEIVELDKINANSVIMSNVFEHFYEPLKILEKLRDSPNIKYIYLNHPDFNWGIRNYIFCILNVEHIWYVENEVVIKLFENYGFYLNRQNDFMNQTLELEFVRRPECANNILINTCSEMDITNYFNNILNIVDKLNNKMLTHSTTKYYLWPASLHSIPLFTMGLRYDLLSGMLDNSPNKIGKYLQNYRLYCSSFSKILEEDPENTCIIISSAGNYLKEIDMSSKNIKFININDLNNE